MLIGSMMCMDMVSSPYRHTQSRGVRLWCGSEYCSRLAIFLDVEMLKHFFFCGPTRGTHAMEWEHQPHGLNVAHAVSRSETGGLNFRLYYIKENLEIYKY